jgi:hypothetical protein
MPSRSLAALKWAQHATSSEKSLVEGILFISFLGTLIEYIFTQGYNYWDADSFVRI